MKPSLLSVCSSSELREVRHRVLETRYQVTSICNVAELEALSTDSAFSIVLLCHSLTTSDCETVVPRVRVCWPSAGVVAMAASLQGCAIGCVDATVEALAGPAVLFAAIDGCLENQRVTVVA